MYEIETLNSVKLNVRENWKENEKKEGELLRLGSNGNGGSEGGGRFCSCSCSSFFEGCSCSSSSAIDEASASSNKTW